MIPVWILDSAAGLVLAVAVLSGARLVLARPSRDDPSGTDTDAAYFLIGLALAGLLATGVRVLSNGEWKRVFALLMVWFAFRVVRNAHENRMPQLIHSAAMLYLFQALAVTSSGGSEMAGMPVPSGAVMQTLKYPTLAFIFGLILVGYSIWDLDQVSGGRYSLTGGGVSLRVDRFLLSPDMAVCRRIVTGVTMAFVLFTRI